MIDTHVRLGEELADAARLGAGLPESISLAALVRYCLAKVAGWPEPAAHGAARSPGKAG